MCIKWIPDMCRARVISYFQMSFSWWSLEWRYLDILAQYLKIELKTRLATMERDCAQPTWKRPTSIDSATATSNFFSSNNSCLLGKLLFVSCLYIDICRKSPVEYPGGWSVGLGAAEVGDIDNSTSLSTTCPTIRQTTAKVPVKKDFRLLLNSE